MSQVDLDVLEREVEAARKRLANDIERMRNPAALSGFRNDVMAKASSLKDEFLRKASDTASGTAQRVWSDLKARASANPGATLAIGAGLAWHLARHPPITTLLVGLGLTSLMRTNPSSNPSPVVTRATELAETVKQKAQQWGEEARDGVGSVSEKARGWGEDAREVAGELISEVSNMAADGHSSHVAEHVFPDSAARDTYLLGAAALAIGAATVIAVQRKDG
jgi:hypothetical protein